MTRLRRSDQAGNQFSSLLRSTYSLALNVVLTSALGIGFWIVAARIFPSSEVGRDSALISAMATLSAICQLNLADAIPRFLPIVRVRPEHVVWAAYLLVAVVSAVGAAAFVLIAPAVSPSFRFLSTQPSLAVLFAAAVVVWGIFTLEDAVLTAARRAVWVPVENGTFGALKIAALPVLLAVSSGHPVFIAWVAPVVALVIPVNLFIFLRVLRKPIATSGQRSPIERFGLRGLFGFLAQDYVAYVFVQAAAGLLPVLVLGLLGGSAGAYFYMPFALIGAFDVLFELILQPLTVEAAIDEARLPELAMVIVRRFGWLLVAGIAVLAAGASLILAPFGARYAHAGAPLLRLLAAASLFRAITALYIAICRVEGRASRILAAQAARFVLLVALTVLLAPSHGLVGVGLAWLAASAIVASATVWHVVAVLRRGRHVPPGQADDHVLAASGPAAGTASTADEPFS